MRKAIETRLDRLVEARQEQDAATVSGVISEFLGEMTPDELYECREPAILRPQLEAFLATQPNKIIAIIERWSRNRKATK